MASLQPYPNSLHTVSIPRFLLWKPYRNTETQTQTQTRDRDPRAHSQGVVAVGRSQWAYEKASSVSVICHWNKGVPVIGRER